MVLPLIIENPLGYLFLYLFVESPTNPITTLLVLSLITTLFAYPFLYFGKFLLQKVEEKWSEWRKWKQEFLTAFTVNLCFWIFIRLWYVVMGNAFTTDLFGLVRWIVFTGILGYLIYLLGKRVHRKMTERWEMPFPISLLIVIYLMNLLIWVILYFIIIVFLQFHGGNLLWM